VTVPGPGWYEDPQDAKLVRWWDGTRWSEHTHDRAPQSAPVSDSAATEIPAEPYVPMGGYGTTQVVEPQLTHKEKDRQTRKNNSLAYTGTVLALVGFLFNPFAILSILGIVFSSIGLAKSHELAGAGYKVTGHGTAIAGIIVGLAGLALFAYNISRYL
jgi:hypothetical protein